MSHEGDPAYEAWEALSPSDRKALFLGMYTYMEIADPGSLMILEITVGAP